MKRLSLICMFVFGLVLSWSMVCFGESNFAHVERTGQTKSYAAGDDGDLKKGVTYPNTRFTDNGDGTVTDNLTGLMWLKNANCIQTKYPGFDTDETAGDGIVSWQHALDFVAGINAGTYTTCGSTYTDWRLPNVRELHSLIHFGYHNPAVSNTAGTGQWTEGDPFTGLQLQSSRYWSATTHAKMKPRAWDVRMLNGYLTSPLKSSGRYVWPVRAGQ